MLKMHPRLRLCSAIGPQWMKLGQKPSLHKTQFQTRTISMITDFFKGSQTGPYKNIHSGLKEMYSQNLKPLEKMYLFPEFHSPLLTEADFMSKPSVMFIGQYSTGKTTFLQHIIGKDYPGMRIGPEPTTDKFVVIMNGPEDSLIPGNALVVDPSLPYSPLARFGNRFLNRLQAVRTSSTVLENITLIDTPGILSGEKQLIDRGYDFGQVTHWFAERVDRVVLLFDAHKLDISDEFKHTIEMLKSYEDKLRIVLNKSDQVSSQQLMRVYGALMWNLGKIVGSPEVTRVFIGSFWKRPLQYLENSHLFELEHQDLLHDLQTLPRQNSIRKLNDFIRRARSAKVHAYIISELKYSMPRLFKKKETQAKLIVNLGEVYRKIQNKYGISPGDFPDIMTMQRKLSRYDFSKFAKYDASLISGVDAVLETRLPSLLSGLKTADLEGRLADVEGGIFDLMKNNPFESGAEDGINRGRHHHNHSWIVAKDIQQYEKTFRELLDPGESELSGDRARPELMKSQLPKTDLALVWRLADVDGDGFLDLEQWALANYLIELRLEGHELPNILPKHLKPPGRHQVLAQTEHE